MLVLIVMAALLGLFGYRDLRDLFVADERAPAFGAMPRPPPCAQ